MRKASAYLMVFLLACMILQSSSRAEIAYGATYNPNPPSHPVRFIFIHHSTGEYWLADEPSELGQALRDNNYFVSDTNYGWGPGGIGDHTDIGDWWSWFRGPSSPTYLSALYAEHGQHSSYTRMDITLGGENEIIMFKSCFPNSDLKGNLDDPIPSITSNPLRGQDSYSDYHTVANAKGIYIDLLEYFRIRQDKLFIVITAPPRNDSTYSSNARAFNEWLVYDWLRDYKSKNMFVFDFYNVLTSNGGDPNTNDLNQTTGNHHRWWHSTIQHVVNVNHNETSYWTTDEHPSVAGNLKATGEFLPLLNIAYNLWISTKTAIPLKAGWNLISLPIIPSSPSITRILQYQIAANEVVAVWSYNAATRTWLSFRPGSSSTLTTMTDGNGYWIYMRTNDTLYLDGSVISPTSPPPTYSLVVGWNLVGFKSQPNATEPKLVSNYLSSIDGKYDANNVWVYDNESGNWLRVESSDMLQPGQALWILMTSPATLKP